MKKLLFIIAALFLLGCSERVEIPDKLEASTKLIKTIPVTPELYTNIYESIIYIDDVTIVITDSIQRSKILSRRIDVIK